MPMQHFISTLGDQFKRLFYILFALAFGLILLNAVFNKQLYNHSVVATVLLMGVSIAAILIFSHLVQKTLDFWQRYYDRVLLGFLLILLAVQIAFGFLLRIDPIWDLEAIYQGAIEWVNGGDFTAYSSQTCHADYFYIFPNNLGGLAFLAVLFKLASLIGITDTYAVAMVVNSVMMVAALGLASLTLKRLFGVRHAVVVLFLFLISPPFYFAGAVIYTDFFSILFPILLFYLFLRLYDSKRFSQCFVLAVFMGVLAAVGMLLKFTVLIAVIAAGICLLLNKQLKKLLILLLCVAIVVGGVYAAFDHYMYSTHLDREKAEKMNLPYLHWVMMGLNGGGGFNNEDLFFSLSLNDPATKNQIELQRIGQRLSELGVVGTLELMLSKATVAFYDGTFALSDFLDDNPQNETALHDYLLYDGEHYAGYRLLCTGIFMAVLLLMLFGAFSCLFSHANRASPVMVAYLSVFGIMLFLTMWEVQSRYINNMLPLIFVCAAFGSQQLYDALVRVKKLWHIKKAV